MDPILDAALSQHPQTQGAAVDILSFTIKQGLAHPLQSFPVIVALETSPNSALSARASALHAVLHSKHASLLNSRYIISARASFSYQAKLAQGRGGSCGVQGARGGTALLHRWFALVREKRAPKLDFLKALVRAFDVGTSLVAAQEDIDFARYMAENFAAFDYKTQEEVLLVIKCLTNVLSTVGMQCVEALSPGHLRAQLQAPNVPPATPPKENGTDACISDATATAAPAEQGGPCRVIRVAFSVCSYRYPAPATMTPAWQILEKLPLLRTSVLVALIMLLKAYLKNLYGLSEEYVLSVALPRFVRGLLDMGRRKCLKWVAGKKNAQGDKPATRRTGAAAAPLTWMRLPFATRPLLTVADMAAQRDTVRAIFHGHLPPAHY
jgi:cohesin loading factor subunit SCC2